MSMSRVIPNKTAQNGFSLIELIIVIGLVCLISALAYSHLLSKTDSAAGERALESVAERVAMRRDEAIRLNGLQSATSLESEIAPLVEIDFSDLNSTASLIINGRDNDNDHYDDDTGEMLTFLESDGWKYSYRKDSLELPDSWHVVSEKEMPVKLIGGGGNGQGVPVTKVGFDADGRAYGYNAEGIWEKYPSGSSTDESYSPFWTIYIVRSSSNKKSEAQAVAVAVYPSGQIEKFRYDGSVWRGWRGRAINE